MIMETGRYSLNKELSRGNDRSVDEARSGCEVKILFAFMYPKRYDASMIQIRQTEANFQWFVSLRDQKARD
jgi:hypothetical protein